jgi:hypothetical protein
MDEAIQIAAYLGLRMDEASQIAAYLGLRMDEANQYQLTLDEANQ